MDFNAASILTLFIGLVLGGGTIYAIIILTGAGAGKKAEKIISDAQAEADRKLSEADFIKALEKEGIRIRTQVQQDCEEIKRKAMEEAENIRAQATEDAMRTKEGAELYAEQVLTNLEKNLTQQQQIVKNGQVYMEKLRSDSFGSYDVPTSYSSERAQQFSDYRPE